MRKIAVRLILLCIGIALIITYQALERSGYAGAAYLNVIRPMHEALAGICDATDAAVIEILIVALVVCVFIRIVYELVYIIHKHKIVYPLLSIILTGCMLFCLIYGLFCVLWGVTYDAPDVYALCGIAANPDGVLHEDLVAVDKFFADKANEYSYLVVRDPDGACIYDANADISGIIEHSQTLYDGIARKYPGLDGPYHRPKGIFFSGIMSYMDFEGFYSPFTGEMCYNTDSPAYSTPAVIAHEMAHSRGIAAEDEANFIAIIACLEDGDPDYVYSASLLALVHLQNALYKSGDAINYNAVRDSYAPGVRADLNAGAGYWGRYRESMFNRAASSTYDSFLKSYDQALGRETYGACVDLLVEYYK